MGIFNGFFGPKYPPLPEGHPTRPRIESQGDALIAFVEGAHDAIELLPGDGPLYVFVGKPPKAFGIVWFDAGERFDIHALASEGRIGPAAGPVLAKRLGEIYERHAADERFTTGIGNRTVVVTPSSDLYAEVDQAVAAIVPPV